MGMTGVGKSYLVQALSGKNVRVGHDLSSCTQDIRAVECAISGNAITLVDTPGFDDTSRSDTEILENIATWLAKMHCHKVCGVIYMHSVLDDRMRGSSYKNLRMFEKICGKEVLKNVVMLTNRWGHIDEKTACDREKELADKFLKMYLTAGCRMMRYRTKDDLLRIVEGFLNISPTLLGIQKEMVDERKSVSETSAGALAGAAVNMSAELEQVRKKLDATLKADTEKYNKQRLEQQQALKKVEASYTQLKQARQIVLYDSSRNLHVQICHDRFLCYNSSRCSWVPIDVNPTGHWKDGIFYHKNGRLQHNKGQSWIEIQPKINFNFVEASI
ncbi:hypothetical protein BGZ80_010968 [Entomortierella chlamydospora]|uniref:G domain-containing protein n=1 Tax=Entomortierella chlamydospora TaxID=101097 RepID=A0A9P6SZH0_9FUNG|nr:hypothetical protein BGZ80_010968 [Entomortierella chlamydospora]